MYYGKGILKQTNHYIFNKIIKKIIFLKALIFIGDDTLKINLYMNEDLIQLFSVLRVANSLLFINNIGYVKIEENNNKSLYNERLNPKYANRIFHDNIIELKFLYYKSHNNKHDKAIILDFLKMSKRNSYNISIYINEGFELFDEVFNLLLNSNFFSKKQKLYIKNYKEGLMINRKK